MFKEFLHGLLLVGVTVSVLVATGCGRTPLPTPTDRAEAVLGQFLDSWTRGEPADKFADPNQPIQASDPDRTAGYRLLSFLNVASEPGPEGPQHVRCRVALSLQDRKGVKTDREVLYDVRMGDKTAISRLSLDTPIR